MREGKTCFGSVMDEKGPHFSGKVGNRLEPVHNLYFWEEVVVAPGLDPHAG